MNKPSSAITIVGPYLIHNFGDDLIGSVLARHLQLTEGHAVWIPGLSSENCRWIGVVPERLWYRALRQSRGLLIGGGGILGHSGGSTTILYLKTALKAAVFAAWRKTPIVITGVGAGLLPSWMSRILCRELCRQAICIGVRDASSSEVLASLGVPPSKIQVGADVALCWPDLLETGPIVENDRIGLQFDPYRYPAYLQNESRGGIDARLHAFCTQNSDNMMLVSNSPRNTSISRRLRFPFTVLNYEFLPDFLAHLAGLRVIITSHLHLAIAAYAVGIPCFSLYVMEKTKRFYDQIGHPERALALESARPEQVDQLLEAATTAQWSPTDEKTRDRLKEKSRGLLDLTRTLR